MAVGIAGQRLGRANAHHGAATAAALGTHVNQPVGSLELGCGCALDRAVFQNPLAGLKSQVQAVKLGVACLLYTSPSPRDGLLSRMPSSA